MVITSSVVKDGGTLTDKFTCNGVNSGQFAKVTQLPLQWTGAPAGTKSFATNLPENVSGVGTELQKFITPSEGAAGTYAKHITLYGLSANVNIAAGSDVETLRKALNAVTLDSAVLN